MKVGRTWFAVVAAAVFTSGCASSQQLAVTAAMKHLGQYNPKVLGTLPREERSCYWGCFTQVCVMLEVDNPRPLGFPFRDVVFVFVDGGGDEQLAVRGAFKSLQDCMKNYNRG
jgi:hypothetical protein